MKNLKVTVNGQIFDVTVEEVDSFTEHANQSQVAPQSQVASQPVVNQDKVVKETTQQPESKPAPTPSKPANNSDGEAVTAPMPGTVMNIAVSAGQKVKKGDLLLTFEAMKMENDIVAYRDATIVSVLVSKGDTIDSGTNLITIA